MSPTCMHLKSLLQNENTLRANCNAFPFNPIKGTLLLIVSFLYIF